MTPNEVLNDPNFVNHSLEVFFKWLFVAGAFLYTLFTLIVIRQIGLMKKTLITEFSPLIASIGVVHFFLATIVLAYYLLFI